jgi:Arc/MetJ-type ribon-helix-helix transcriptional regulator
MSSKTVNLSLPAELLRALDKAAKANYASRSDFIRESVVQRLKREAYDAAYPITTEFDDGSGETWRTVVDFRDKDHPAGVSFDEVIEALEKLEERDRQNAKTTGKARRKKS